MLYDPQKREKHRNLEGLVNALRAKGALNWLNLETSSVPGSKTQRDILVLRLST